MTSSLPVALLVFCGSLLLNIMSSAVMAERLDQVGTRFAFPAGLLGLVTALGADAPEIASAITALVSGQHEFGRGVIFGSNIFNIAMLLGFSAVLAGRVAVGRPNLVLNAGISLGVTLVAAAQTIGWLGRISAGIALAMLLVPYVLVLSVPVGRTERLPLPRSVTDWLRGAITAEKQDEAADTHGRTFTPMDGLGIVPLLASIVASSVAMVKTAEFLGSHWQVPQIFVGIFAIATLTGIPNLVAAIRLASRGRGEALTSEAFNSNTLNILVGAYMPTLFMSMTSPSREAMLATVWLLGMTAAALGLGLAQRGFGRGSGAVLLGGYAGFVVAVIL